MNLAACCVCGAVYDLDKAPLSGEDTDDGDGKCIWNGYTDVKSWECACGELNPSKIEV